jgi:CheY-like chemotaxis protein
MNLLVNARDALPHGGRITATAENVELDEHYASMVPDAAPGPYVRVSVVDTGVGMAPDIAAQIFDPFFTTKEVGKGTGLGLSTVAAIVRSHGGFINVYSEPGSGTTFRLYLPADTQDTRPTRPAAFETPRGGGELVLVIDDEGSIRDITRQTLEAFGYRVLTATDGADAVATYGRMGSEIDVVLTDMVMPIMDGPATIRALRRMDPSVRIIGASGLGANGRVVRALEEGVEHFLPKPYTAQSLLEMIHRVLHE